MGVDSTVEVLKGEQLRENSNSKIAERGKIVEDVKRVEPPKESSARLQTQSGHG